jgi:predicted Zn-dependent peptidase
VNGVSHYLERMLFKGTDRRPDAIQIAEAIEGAGGEMLVQRALSRHQVTSATRLRRPVFS